VAITATAKQQQKQQLERGTKHTGSVMARKQLGP
jgi:hypothetical protein